MFKVNSNVQQAIEEIVNFFGHAEMILSCEVVQESNNTVLNVKSDEAVLQYAVYGQEQEKKMKDFLTHLLSELNDIFNGEFNWWIQDLIN